MIRAIAIAAAIVLGDGQFNPLSVACYNGSGAAFTDPVLGLMTVYGTCGFQSWASDGGGIGGLLSVNHIGQIAGSAGPTCGAYQNVLNPFDAGATCLAGSTDMSGTIITNGCLPNHGSIGVEVPLLYVQPGTPWSTSARCEITPQFSPGLPAGLAGNLTLMNWYPRMDGGANALQMMAITAETLDSGYPYAFSWVCWGQ